jgi:hypothetical protein
MGTEMTDPETCSWCVVETDWEMLTETDEGNLCPECLDQL